MGRDAKLTPHREKIHQIKIKNWHVYRPLTIYKTAPYKLLMTKPSQVLLEKYLSQKL